MVKELYIVMVVGFVNDVIVVLVEYVVGFEEVFVKMMNEEVKWMGMKDMFFINFIGFDCVDMFVDFCLVEDKEMVMFVLDVVILCRYII